VCDLGERVHTAIGAPGAGDRNLVADDRAQPVAERPGDCPLKRLGREPVKLRAVVGDAERESDSQTNSMRAIGALSPGRGPSLRIRR
jgi:hypothetical protein